MFPRFHRLLIALTCALLAAAATLAMARAQEGSDPAPQQAQEDPDCVVCHTEFEVKWQAGPHGQAGSDPAFVEEWTAQGQPGACLVCHTTGYDPAAGTWKSDNVACEACHGEAPAEHPREPMPVEQSPDLCGRCHSDTRFGWQDWQGSTHFQRGMSCTTCHDPHSASLKVTGPRDGTASRMAPSCASTAIRKPA
jgi:predicted CXXCH cytochrome family protein